MPAVPLVSVLVSVHDGERYLRAALESVLGQTVRDLELVVVDDASGDGTAGALADVRDGRLRVLRNDERLGLAASLNRALEEARGRYVARMDADDVALPHWLERSLALISVEPAIGIVGSGVVDVDEDGRPGHVHVFESGRAIFRWHALFSSPAFHDTVVLERDLLELHGLRYDESFGESEDYELWTRLLAVTEGDSVPEPLVLHRLHAEQASRRRGELQRELARTVSLKAIAALAPGLAPRRAELARAIVLGADLGREDTDDAAVAVTELLERFSAAARYPREELTPVRHSVSRALARVGSRVGGNAGRRALRRALALDPLLPVHVAARRTARRRTTRRAKREATRLLESLGPDRGGAPIGVAAVFPEPTPYRAPLLDRVSSLPEIDLTVLYAADTVARRTWQVEPRHRAVFLRGVRLPGAELLLHHDYPVTPGVARALTRASPSVVVVSGWSTFASQAAITWCRIEDVPYVLVVESHDEGPRSGWRKAVKRSVVPRVVRGAAGVLVTGTLARRSMVERGAQPDRVRVFANTIDVEAFGERAAALAPRREGLRSALGAGPEDVVVLSVARLVPEKGLDTLIRAVAAAGDARLLVVVAGSGSERERLRVLAERTGVRLHLAGDVEWERIVELYAGADVFALLSEREPWAVVVNEAAACGLPLVLSERVGAAHDLLRDGENGALVPAGDVEAAAAALRALTADAELRRSQGARSREIVADWGYEPSVAGFVAAIREAVSDTRG